MTSTPRWRRAAMILGFLMAIPILGVATAFVWINHVADRRWTDAQARIRQLAVDHPPDVSRRPTSGGSALSKDIQIHFVAAIREAARTKDREFEALMLVFKRQGGEAVDVILRDAQDFLDRLHQGARLCTVSPSDFPPPWRGVWDTKTLAFMMHCSVLRARQLRERNAPFEAVEALLDSLQLARFWAAAGQGLGRITAVIFVVQALDELRDILSRETLSSEELQRMERELGPLEGVLRSPLGDLGPLLARWAETLETFDSKSEGILERAPYRWKYLLPESLLKAEAFEFCDRHARQLLACEGKPYPELLRCRLSENQERAESTNPLIKRCTLFDDDLAWVELRRMAELRLLRCAARYRATGEILKLEDPFGGVILHSSSGSRMKFWSLGDNGRDDGGDPGAEGRWTRSPAQRPAEDFVIEVELRRPP